MAAERAEEHPTQRGTQRWNAEQYQSRHAYVWKHGEGVVDLLAPQPGERIVDLGCGAGQLTAQIAASGAQVTGFDRSAEMIAQARANFPQLDFRVADAIDFALDAPADAVFSSAVLHWIRDAGAVIDAVARALRCGGRFVLEMGGHGNVQTVLDGVRQVIGDARNPWFFPTLSEYSTLLEQRGFEVRFAALFDRPTILEGESGMEDWLVMFGGAWNLSASQRAEAARLLRGRMYRDGSWILDYRRLRISAVKL